MASIKVNKKEYNFKFDFLALRKFAKAVGLKKPSEIEQFFNKMDLEDPSFDDMDNIAHLVRSGIKHAKVPTFELVLEEITTNPDTMTKAFAELNGSMETETSPEEEKEGSGN